MTNFNKCEAVNIDDVNVIILGQLNKHVYDHVLNFFFVSKNGQNFLEKEAVMTKDNIRSMLLEL